MPKANATTKAKRKYNAAALITSAVRRIWSWSPLRREALKRAKMGKVIHCEECGEITDKPEVHHNSQADVYVMAKVMADKLFPPLEELTVCCPECHLEKHRREKC